MVFVLFTVFSLLIRLYFIRYRAEFDFWDSVWYVVVGHNLALGRGLTDFAEQVHIWFQPGYPFFIAIADILLDDPVLSARVVSALFGSLTIIPTFLLARTMYSERVAYVASILVVFNYRLIESSTDAMSEMTFAFFLMMTLFLTFRIGQQDRGIVEYLLLGLVLGAAALIRTEGAAFAFAAVTYLLVCSVQRRAAIRTGLKILLTVAVFCVAFAPYVLFLHRQTGHWTITGRSTWAMLMDLETKDVFWQHCDFWTLIRDRWPYILKRMLFNVDYALRKDLITAIHPVGIVLTAIGFFGRPWLQGRGRTEGFAIGSLFPFVTVYAIQGWPPRYYFSYLFLVTIWMAKGVDNLHWWFCGSFSHAHGWGAKLIRRDFRYLAAVVIAVVFCLFLHKTTEPIRMGGYRQAAESQADHEVGRWLRDNGARGARFLSPSPLVPFYSEGDQITCNVNLAPSDLDKFLQEKSIDYIVLDPRWNVYYPQLAYLKKGHAPSHLRLLEEPTWFRYARGDDRIMVYQVLRQESE